MIGSTEDAQPPKLARRLLQFLLRTKMGEEYAAALDELFADRIVRQGRRSARNWYWRQLFGFVIRRGSFKRFSEAQGNRPAVGSVHGRDASIVETLAQDFIFSVRRFRSEPSFAVTVALTLSLGIGASTAVFGVLTTTLLSRVPYSHADRLAVGRTTYTGSPEGTFNGVSIPNYADYREANHSFESLAAVWDGAARATVTGGGEPWVARTSYASWNLFRTLRVEPILGRQFSLEEEAQEDARVVIISYGLWQSRFGGSRDVLGRTLVLEGAPRTIVGVLPQAFRFLWNVEVWHVASRPGADRDMNAFYLVGRLDRGVSMELARSDVEVIARSLERQHPEINKNARLQLVSLQAFLMRGVRIGLLLPAAATACLLLIACANVAGLLLARGQRRMAEMAMRTALGASRWRLVKQLLTESVALTLPAGLVGIGIAFLFQRVLLHLVPMNLLGVSQPVVDGPVLLFALLASVATALIVGIVPAIRGSAIQLSPNLGTGRYQSERHKSTRLRGGLVSIQIAVSIVLLVGAGLVARSLSRLMSVDLGFSTEQIHTVGVRIPATVNQDREAGQSFFASVLQEVQSIPGVQSSGAISRWPIRSPGGNWLTRAADRPPSEGDQGERAYLRWVSPGYFNTMNQPIQRGRDVLDTDLQNTPRVAVLSESLARRLYHEQDPVGKTVLLIVNAREGRETAFEVIGVVGDARLNNLRTSGEPALYLSALQSPRTWMGIVVSARGDPAAITETIREIVRREEPNALVTEVASMDEVLDSASADFRRVVRYLGLFAITALLLAAVGLYGALAYHVSQQEHEIGVRLAVGASRPNILRLVLRRGSRIVFVGLIVGLAGAYPGTVLVRDLLFNIAPLDPMTYVGAVLVLGLVAVAACLVPARRAMRIDPVVLLRSE